MSQPDDITHDDTIIQSETPCMGRGMWKLNSSLLEVAKIRQSFEEFFQTQVPLVDLCNRSKYPGVRPLMRRLPGKKESVPAAWFRETSDRFWNSVIPGRPTLAKVVVAGTSLIVIVLGLGLWLFIYVYRKFHPEYLQVEEELFKGKRVMRPDSPTGLLSMMLRKPVPEKHHAVKKHRDIEEGDDEEEQRRALSDWLIAASNYMAENEQETEESEDDSTADEGVRSKAVKKYVAKRVKKLTNQLKDKSVAIKKEVKQAKNIIATKTKNIKVKEAKNILAKKTQNIMAKKTKNIKVKKAKNMAKKTKNIMVKKIKKLKRRK